VKHLWQDERVPDVAEMVKRLGLSMEDFSESEKDFLGPFDRDAMLEEIKLPATPHERRAVIGRRLSLLGDPRSGVGVRSDGLPDIGWCEVPGGEVVLEEVNETFQVDPFFIAKYPVTWVQYEAFLKAKEGFHNSAWWEGCPYRIDKPGRQFNPYANHPAENLCWWEALAFCRWLSDRLGCEIGLPTEWQWQQAATGGDPQRDYPWPGEWDNGRTNTYESELGRTTAVGMYPHGASPVGAMDMAGNVWEFCLNEFDRPCRVELTGEVNRVMRGGSFNVNPNDARAAFRSGILPDDRFNVVGFRVVCASPIR
jgi:formylglycine-generating enzyme required for sulfatase activity